MVVKVLITNNRILNSLKIFTDTNADILSLVTEQRVLDSLEIFGLYILHLSY